ncbi:hypothetical protein [Acidiphilium acidophilum]|uniref:hypothetical protein n=1 Tax=Acidiphilium acidophilum TaxID=76588 RepID=UPI002E8E6E75|nr:hypothetical protein [Acidiphilium acidophilum]
MEITESRALAPVRSKKTSIPAVPHKRRSSENGGAGTGRWGIDQTPKGDRQFFRDSMSQWRKNKVGIENKPHSPVLAERIPTKIALRRSFALGTATAIGGGASLMVVIALLASIFGWTGPTTILGISVIFSAFSAGIFIQLIEPDNQTPQYEPSVFPIPDASSQEPVIPATIQDSPAPVEPRVVVSSD